MTHILTLVAPEAVSRIILAPVREALAIKGAKVGVPDWLSPDRACDLPFSGLPPVQVEDIARQIFPHMDIAVQSMDRRRKQLLLADMDSTMIQIESLDTLADRLGFGEQVREITERGMCGELDFRQSLETRVALLKGQPAMALEGIVANIPYTAGARTTIQTLRANDCYTVLVSGGFTFFSSVVAEHLGFHEHRANQLEIKDGLLTGRVIEPMLDRNSKRNSLLELCKQLGISPEAACAVGDGANDLAMIAEAGMGIAYHAKPIVRQQARYRIDSGDLTTLLYFQGYRDSEFVTG